MSERSYNQYCGIAYALDILGERWTLLIIRELLLGPQRFKDLQETLQGIGTNLLSDRLKKLQNLDLIHQRDLPPPAASTVYELTKNGQELKPVLESLAEWGSHFLGAPDKNDVFNPRWLLLALKTKFQPKETIGVDSIIEFRIDDEVLYTHIQNGSIETQQGEHPDADLTIKSDSKSFITLVSDPDKYKTDKSDVDITLKGKTELFEKLSKWFDT